MNMGNYPLKGIKCNFSFGSLLLALIFLVVAGCSSSPNSTASTKTDPNDTIQRFEQAVKRKDTSEWMNLAISMDKMYELTLQDAQAYIDFFHEHEHIWQLELERLQAMAAGHRLTSRLQESTILHLTYSEGKWGGSGEYKIGVQPSYIMVTTDFKNTEIYMNDEWYTTTNTDDYFGMIGPLEPGEYTLLAKLESDVTTFTSKEEKVVLPASESPQVYLEIQASAIHFDTNVPEADLYLNGEYTGMTIAEANEAKQLLPTDGSIRAQAKLKLQDRMLESEPVLIDGATYYLLEIPTESIQLSTSISGSQLYVNDVATDHLVYFDQESEYGPFGVGAVVHLHAEVDSPWGKLKGYQHTVSIEEDEYLFAYLGYQVTNEELRKVLEQSLIDFIVSGFQAIEFDNEYLLDRVMESSRYSIYHTLHQAFVDREATLIDVNIHTDSAELFGSINGSTIESLSVAPLYMEVTYEYPFTDPFFDWDEDWGTGAEEEEVEPFYVEDRLVFSILLNYNVDSSVWEVEVLDDVSDYMYFPDGESDKYFNFR